MRKYFYQVLLLLLPSFANRRIASTEDVITVGHTRSCKTGLGTGFKPVCQIWLFIRDNLYYLQLYCSLRQVCCTSKWDLRSTTKCDQIHKYQQNNLGTLFVLLKSSINVETGLYMFASVSQHSIYFCVINTFIFYVLKRQLRKRWVDFELSNTSMHPIYCNGLVSCYTTL